MREGSGVASEARSRREHGSGTRKNHGSCGDRRCEGSPETLECAAPHGQAVQEVP